MVRAALRVAPVVLLLVSSASAAPPPADLAPVLARAGTAAATLHENLPDIVSDENYEQVGSGYYATSRWSGLSLTSTLRWSYEPMLSQWQTHREIRTVTGEQGRVPGPSGMAPTSALMALLPEHQPRFQFVHRGTARTGTTPVVVVGFREVGEPTLFRDPEGRSLPVSGVFWIEPGSGQVFRIRYSLARDPDAPVPVGRYSRVDVDITLGPDRSLGANVPLAMRETYSHDRVGRWPRAVPTYEGTSGADHGFRERLSCRATYTNHRRSTAAN